MGTLNKVYIYCCLAIIPLALLDVSISIMKGGNHCLHNLELPSEELRATKAHSTVFLKQHATISTTETTAIRIMFNNEMRSSHVKSTLLGNYLNKKKKEMNFSYIFESKTKPNKTKYLYMYLYSESKWEKQQKTMKNLRRVTESRYTSAGVGIFSLGLVTTLALLFICRYAENRNRDALNPLVADVSTLQHVYVEI